MRLFIGHIRSSCILLMGLPFLAPGQSATLTLGSGSTAPGGTVAVPLTLSGGLIPAAVQWSLTYDSSDISNISIAAGPTATAAGKSVACADSPGHKICIISGLNQYTIGDGVVANLTFQISAAPSSNSIPVQVAGMVAASSAGSGIPSAGVGGVITVSTGPSALAAFTCTPGTVFAGAPPSCIATLSDAAGKGGANLAITSNNANVVVPATVTIPADSSTALFTPSILTIAGADQAATITAAFGSQTVAEAVTITAVPLFYLRGSTTELIGTADNSKVIPTVGPAGFTGSLTVRGKGYVGFNAASATDGMYFDFSGRQNSDTAFITFTGSGVENLFKGAGEVRFYLKSAYSFAQRQSYNSPRFVYDVFDSTGRKPYFLIITVAGRLLFAYATGATPNYYTVPAGQEDALFGSGVVAKFRLVWDGKTNVLYVNDAAVATNSYTPYSPLWTSAPRFTLGASNSIAGLTYAGFYSLDDTVAEFELF